MLCRWLQRADGAGEWQYIGEQCAAVWGMPAADLQLHGDWLQLIAKPQREQIARQLLQAAGDGQECRLEFVVEPPGQGARLLAANLMAQWQQAGGVLWSGCVQPASSVNQELQQCLAEKESLRLALAGADLGAWDWSLDSNLVWVNERWYQMLGMAVGPPQLDVAHWENLVNPDDWQAVRAALYQHLAGESEQYDAEYRLRHHDGHWIWVQDRGRVVERDADGKPLRVVGTHLDISMRKLAEEAMRNSEAHFRHLFANHDAVMLLIDPASGAIVDANAAAALYYGYSHAQLVGMGIADINTLSAQEVQSEYQEAAREQRNHFYFRHRLADGRVRDVEVHSSPVESGGSMLLFSIIHDVTEQKQAEHALRQSQRRLEAVIESVSGAVLVESENEKVIILNQTFCSLFGLMLPASELGGRSSAQLARDISSTFSEPQQFLAERQRLLFARRGDVAKEYPLRDGRVLECDVVTVSFDGEYHGMLWVFRDISERKAQEHELYRLATTDALTGLSNRRSFLVRLEQEFLRQARFSQPVAVLMLDLDHFKQVNDQYGHAVGDLVLRAFAQACQQQLRRVDVAGRLGGEEFAILLPGCEQAGAVKVAEHLRHAIEVMPLQAAGQTFHITISVGVSLLRSHHQAGDAALIEADRALYQAKAAGRNRVEVYNG